MKYNWSSVKCHVMITDYDRSMLAFLVASIVWHDISIFMGEMVWQSKL